MDAAGALAQNLASITYGDLPPEVVEHTKKQVLDIIGVTLGGSTRPGIMELAEIIADWGGKAESTVLGYGLKVPAPNAAQVNASMGHALDYDDTGDGPTHPSVVIVPTALAVAERRGGVSGQDFIAAVALGEDMMCRLGRSFRSGLKTEPAGGHPGAGWHLTPLYGFLSSAGVAGCLIGLDAEGIVNAIGIAYHQSSGNGQCVNEGVLTKRMGPGFAARGGIVAALMAEKGITGAKESIEGELGIFNLYHHGEYDPVPLTADLGKRFLGINAAMKPYPCCKGTHSYVEAALAMVGRHEFAAEDIKEITIYCPDEKYVLLYPLEKRSRPENIVDSQFSIPWAVAAVFARGRAGIGEFTDAAIKSADILAVSGKIKVVEDPGLTGGKDAPAKIRVTTEQGQTFTEQSETVPEGTPDALPFSAYERKFRDCAAYAVKPLSATNMDKVVATVSRLEDLADIRELVELLS